MEPTPDRRNERSDRVPLQIEVELGQGDFQDAFAADSLNLSKGGISMRAPCLPDIGSRLQCRFQCLPSGSVVTAQGEVVWAHLDGERCGEFGLAFVDLDPASEWAIEEMIAEHAAQGVSVGEGPPADVGAPVATLELDGGGGAIAARLASADAATAVFEQDLDLLRLGSGVRTHAPGANGRHGSIAAVELRMVGSVPMLAVTVAFAESSAASVPAPAPAGPDTELASRSAATHDTEPDLDAPLDMLDAATPAGAAEPALAEASPQSTLSEFEAAPDAPAPTEHRAVQHERSEHRAVQHDPARSEHRAASGEAALVHHHPAPAAAGREASRAPTTRSLTHPPQTAHAPPPAPPRPVRMPDEVPDGRRDFSTSFALPDLAGDDPYYQLEEKTDPEWKTLAIAALRALVQQCAGMIAALRAAAAAAYLKAVPQVRVTLLRSGGVLRHVHATQLAPRLGAMRRFASLRRRRTTAGPGSARASGSLGRTLVLGVLGAGVTALGVYALAPSGSDPIELHRAVQVPEAAVGARPAAAADARPASAQPAASAAAPIATATSRIKATPATPPDPKQVPSAKRVPAGSPFAVDVRAGSAAKPAAAPAPKLRFGAAQVPNAKRFALRMSGRVHTLQGVADSGGFSVTVLGGLSLDRAGPISSSHSAVQRSMIINKGDRAELNVRFADGKRPAYQVSAEGNMLYVLIQDK